MTLVFSIQNISDKNRVYCASYWKLPKYDSFLAQKIVIENDERMFLRTACNTANPIIDMGHIMMLGLLYCYYAFWISMSISVWNILLAVFNHFS